MVLCACFKPSARYEPDVEDTAPPQTATHGFYNGKQVGGLVLPPTVQQGGRAMPADAAAFPSSHALPPALGRFDGR